jgi:hypothetical protein
MDKATHRCKHICKPLQADTQTKVCKRASTSPTREKLFFKISFPSKIFKTATAQPTHKDQKTSLTMTAKPTTDRTPAGNSTYKKLAVQWLNEVQFSIKLSCRLTVLCFEIANFL